MLFLLQFIAFFYFSSNFGRYDRRLGLVARNIQIAIPDRVGQTCKIVSDHV